MATKGSRTPIRIDWEQARELAKLFCTAEDICRVLRISTDTLANACKRLYGQTARDWIHEAAVDGRVSLRRKQFELAMQGDRTMLIWLGKQYLGQSDKLEQAGPNGGPQQVVVRFDRAIAADAPRGPAGDPE